MAEFASRLSLRSPAVSYLATTAFNFTSISILLWLAYSSIESRVIATVVAHIAGMLVSMIFCLDFWWTRVSLQMSPPVTAVERTRFLGIATVAVVVATGVVGVVPSSDASLTPVLIALNWMALAAVSIGKYAVMILLVPRQRRVMETLGGIATVTAGVVLAPIWYVGFPLSLPLSVITSKLMRPTAATEAGIGSRINPVVAGFSLFARIPPAVVTKGLSRLFPLLSQDGKHLQVADGVAIAASAPETQTGGKSHTIAQ